jgi:hypothetical protein
MERRAATLCGSRFTTRWDDGEARRRGHYGARQGLDLVGDELDLSGGGGGGGESYMLRDESEGRP